MRVSRNCPVLRLDLREGFKVPIRRENLHVQLTSQSGHHLVHGGEGSADPTKLPVDFAIEAGRFEVHRPDSNVLQKLDEIPPILVRPLDLLDTHFQLTENGNAGSKPSSCESALLNPLSNKGAARDRLAQMVGVEEVSVQGIPISR